MENKPATPSVESLPPYLRKYCATQDYARYTPREHASWRFIMRQNLEFFRDHAVSVYQRGLLLTGIPLDRIPRISEMDEALGKLGWGAVPVVGFIPPAAFLEFQARGCLPIATDMRSLEHIAYTPAPDIVHEAAGHAPIIADPEYAAYLRQYAAMAQKAIISSEDIEVYEAIRLLSDIKENPDTRSGEIERAEANLKSTTAKVTHLSEATLVARMAWWTVEYGLLGTGKNPKIFGAGLLSSVGESRNCLSDRVKKLPLSIGCIDVSYDITKPQPQLFVAASVQHLKDVLAEFDRTMSYRKGGIHGLQCAMKAKNTTTTTLDSGVQIGGTLATWESADQKRVDFLKFNGPTQICFDGQELPDQSRRRHPDGFSSPIGRWTLDSSRQPSTFQPDDLSGLGLRKGTQGRIQFVNGFEVQGVLAEAIWRHEKLVLLTFHDCTVKRGDQVYFKPEWGPFDMVVGEEVISVHGGPASPAEFGTTNMGQAKTSPGRSSPFTGDELTSFEVYQQLRQLRLDISKNLTGEATLTRLQAAANALPKTHTSDWLIALEILEIARQSCDIRAGEPNWLKSVRSRLDDNAKKADESTRAAIGRGLALVDKSDVVH